MSKLNDTVRSLLNNTKLWTLSTCDGTEPNGAPILFKTIDENDNLVMYDIFMDKTLANIAKNGKGAVTFYSEETLEGYQIKGKASYSNDAKYITDGNNMTKSDKLKVRGAVIVSGDKIWVQTPCTQNGDVV